MDIAKVKTQIAQDLENAKRQLDERYSFAAIQEAVNDGKAKLEANAAKLEKDLSIMAAAVPANIATLYEKGALVWTTRAIDAGRYQPELRWAGYYDLAGTQDGGRFQLGNALYRLVIIALPVRVGELSQEEVSALKQVGSSFVRDV